MYYYTDNKKRDKEIKKIENKIGKYCEKIDKLNLKIWILEEKMNKIFEEIKKS